MHVKKIVLNLVGVAGLSIGFTSLALAQIVAPALGPKTEVQVHRTL